MKFAITAKGREWATPGVQASLQRVVAGLDTGIESASPRLQALLRRLAAELAGGVGTLTPQVQERLRRVGPQAAAAEVTAPVPVEAARRGPRMLWWIAGLLALVAAGVAVWRSQKASGEGTVQEAGGEDPEADADLAAGRI